MSVTENPIRLTSAQKSFLDSYLVEFEPMESQAARSIFVQKVAGASFDGAAEPGEIKVAKNLQRLGLLKDVYPHRLFGQLETEPCTLLSVGFTTAGAAALYERAQIVARNHHKGVANALRI